MAASPQNISRLLQTLKVIADLGPELTAERDFTDTSRAMLKLVMDAVEAREAALFSFSESPALLSSHAAYGFPVFPHPAAVPVLPKHFDQWKHTRAPRLLTPRDGEQFFSSFGNVSATMFKCVVPLHMGSKFVGAIALGERFQAGDYREIELDALGLISHYVALSVYNHLIGQTLKEKVTENLRLLASLHHSYDNALEVFASAIDVKGAHMHQHSRRVARYAAGIAGSLGLDEKEITAIRAAGHLHDIGKVAVDKYIFSKPTPLRPEELREVADHTTVGHEIVKSVQFPWADIPETVRWHHERCDGTGYPDRLRADEVSTAVRILQVADSFEAMLSERAYRNSMSIGQACRELVRCAPMKFDPSVVQALLVQVRRDSVGTNKLRFLDTNVEMTIEPRDVDEMAASLMYRMNHARVYSA